MEAGMNGFDVDITANRHGGNPESNAAFDRSKDSHKDDSERIFLLIDSAHYGMTSHEIGERIGRPLNHFSGRLTELCAAGMIERCGRRNGAAIWVSVQPQRRMFA
jgi:hypothetical protein